MHSLEKILAQKASINKVSAGEIITCSVDLGEVNDLYLQVIEHFYEMGGENVHSPDKVAFTFDHYAPAPTIKSATNQKVMREFINNHDVKYLFDINKGVCHQVMVEEGLIQPGRLVIATDSHTTTHGAFGAFGTGVGATDMAVFFLTGKLWFKVPEVIKIEINGKVSAAVMPKDVILFILGKLGSHAAVYKAIEFTGDYINSLNMAGRMVLCNMTVEMGAKTSYIAPDQTTFEFLETNGIEINNTELLYTDKDYVYSDSYRFNIEDLEPQIAVPHCVDNVELVKNNLGRRVDQVFIGSCTGGRLEDIAWAYKILKNKQIKSGTRLIIIPASNKVMKAAVEKGYVSALIESGATFSSPGCGPCMGIHQGVVAENEVCLTTTNRNFPGRMGNSGGLVYLVSPATAAAAALAGKIVDPRNYAEGAQV